MKSWQTRYQKMQKKTSSEIDDRGDSKLNGR